MTVPEAERRVVWVALAAVAALAVASHATSLANGFTWLDHGDVEQGAALAGPGHWLSLFTHGYARTGFYRPIVALTLSVDALVGAPWMFHLSNVLLHALVAVMVALVALSFGLGTRGAALAGALFAVHPVTSLVANQLTYRGDSLVAIALCALLVAHRGGRPGLAAAAMFLGCLSKETAFVLGPAFVVACSLFPDLPATAHSVHTERSRGVAPLNGGRAERSSRDDVLAGPRPWLLMAEGAAFVGALGLRLAFAPAWHASYPQLDAAAAVGTRLAAVSKSALAVLWPFDARICDAFPVTSPWQPTALAGGALLIGLAVVAWRRRGVWVLLFLAVLPSLDLVPAPRFWSPHYLYLPWAFGAVLVAGVIGSRRVVLALAMVAVAGLGLLSLRDALRYRDDETLWTSEVAGRPECREAQLYLGDARRQAGDLDGAASRYEAAAASTPGVIAYGDEAAALQNLGLVRLEQGRHLDAELAFEQALEHQTDPLARRQLTHDLAAVAVARGDPAGAERLLRPEVNRADALRESIALLARALRDMGREDEAVALLRRLEEAR